MTHPTAHARPSAQPTIDRKGNFSAQVSGGEHSRDLSLAGRSHANPELLHPEGVDPEDIVAEDIDPEDVACGPRGAAQSGNPREREDKIMFSIKATSSVR